MYSVVNVKKRVPLILSIFVLSMISPRQFSPSICCAYICHSDKKPIYISGLSNWYQLKVDPGESYDVNRIVYVPMCPELALDVLITQHSHIGREVFSMASQYPAIKRNGW